MKLGKMKKRCMLMFAVFAIGIGVCGFWIVMSHRMSQLVVMSFDEMMRYTTKDNEKAIISVGVIKGGEQNYTVYGSNASLLAQEEHIYEIGSLTKTFTAALLGKAIDAGDIGLGDSINAYLALPEKEYYPTIQKLVTHTSGYRGYYFDWQMATNFLNRRGNDFYGIQQEKLIKKLGKIDLDDKEYRYEYSNFGFAIIGNVLSQVYQTEYAQLMNDFIANDLKLGQTKISDGMGDLNGYWDWKSNDGYLAAGALTSTIGDMMQYIALQLSDELPYLSSGHAMIAEINATTNQYDAMDIRMDGFGMGWIIDTKHGIVWHNGATSQFNSYAAFDLERQIGVVILSNLSPNDKIPATLMGPKLMIALQEETNKQ